MSKKNKGAPTANQSVNVNNAPAPQKSGNFVTVKSKLPYALSFATPDGKVHKINGMNQGIVVKTEGMLGLYATTQLDADVWAYFTRAYAKQPYLLKKHIFADVSAQKAADMAKEIEKDASTKTGLEQIDPNTVPNIQKSEDGGQGAGVTA